MPIFLRRIAHRAILCPKRHDAVGCTFFPIHFIRYELSIVFELGSRWSNVSISNVLINDLRYGFAK